MKRIGGMAVSMLIACVVFGAALQVHGGSANFGAPEVYPVGNDPVRMLQVDVNGDTRPDLVTADFYGNRFSVLQRAQEGLFEAAVDYEMGTWHPNSVAIADFDEDGRLDVAVTNFNGTATSAVSLRFGMEGGGFADYLLPKVQWPALLSRDRPRQLVAGDLNGDSHPDLAFTCLFYDSVIIWYGDGAGAFTASVELTTGDQPDGIAAGDLNSDGRLDLAVADYGATTISVFYADGAGGFLARQALTAGTGQRRVLPHLGTGHDDDWY